jgi:hypothetical protein
MHAKIQLEFVMFDEEEDFITAREKLRATLKAAVKAGEGEDEARAKVHTVLETVKGADLIGSAFKAAFYGDAESTMTSAYKVVVAAVPTHSAESDSALRYVAAAVVFSIVDDRELEEEIAAVLGLKYEADEWPGPRNEPTYARPL